MKDPITLTHVFDLYFSLFRRTGQKFSDFKYDMNLLVSRMIECAYDNNMKTIYQSNNEIGYYQIELGQWYQISFSTRGLNVQVVFNSMSNSIEFEDKVEYKKFLINLYDTVIKPVPELNAWYLVQGINFKHILVNS